MHSRSGATIHGACRAAPTENGASAPTGAPSAEDRAGFQALVGFALSGYQLMVIPAVAKLGVADAIGEEPQPISKIAQVTGANEGELRRVLRVLVAKGIFQRCEDTPDGECVFANNAQSKRLRRHDPLSVWGFFVFNDNAVWPAMGKVAEYLQNAEHFENTTPFDMHHGKVCWPAARDALRAKQLSPDCATQYLFWPEAAVYLCTGMHGATTCITLFFNPRRSKVCQAVCAVMQSYWPWLEDNPETLDAFNHFMGTLTMQRMKVIAQLDVKVAAREGDVICDVGGAYGVQPAADCAGPECECCPAPRRCALLAEAGAPPACASIVQLRAILCDPQPRASVPPTAGACIDVS